MMRPLAFPTFRNLPLVSERKAFNHARLAPLKNVQTRLVRWLDVSIFFGLLSLIVSTAIPYGTVQPAWEAVFECSVFALGALWVCQGLLTGRWQVRDLGLIAPLAALILLAFFQILPIWNGVGTAGISGATVRTISADPYETRILLFKLLALVLAAELLLCYMSSRQRLQALVKVVIAVGVGSALFGIVRQTVQGGAMGFVLASLEPGWGYGQFINRNHFAFLMEMALGLLMGLVVAGGVPRDRILAYLALGGSMWMALVLSNSRGGILSMLCQVLFVGILFGLVLPNQKSATSNQGARARLARLSRSVTARLLLSFSLLVLMGIGVIWLGGDPLARRLETAPKEVATGAVLDSAGKGSRDNISRLEIWRATWRLIKANPITGVGFSGYWTAIAEHHDASGASTPQQAHNDYLELLASGGPIAVALGAWFVIVLIRRARKQLASTDPFRRAACFGALAGLFTIAIHSFVDFGLHITVNALVCVALVVIATADVSIGKREKISHT